MLIYLLRHGLTEYNAEKRYQGQRDIPLSPRALPSCAGRLRPEAVYITPSAAHPADGGGALPGVRSLWVKDLQEMCFGSSRGPQFHRDGARPPLSGLGAANCESHCPDGESKAEFSDRICQPLPRWWMPLWPTGKNAAGHSGPRRHPDGGHGAVRPAPQGLLPLVRPQCGRLCAGCRRLGGAAGAAPGQNCAVHKGGP